MIIQVIMLTLLLVFPEIVTFSLDKPVLVDPDSTQLEIPGSFDGGGWGDEKSQDGW